MLQLKAVLKNVLEIKQMVSTLVDDRVLEENKSLKEENQTLSKLLEEYEVKEIEARQKKEVKERSKRKSN